MEGVSRKVTYRLYPRPAQFEALKAILRAHHQLYNAALQQRIEAWKRQRKCLGFADQCKELTELRRVDPDFRAVNAQSSQVTLKRIDLGFRHFFRRVRQGQTPGFPRFKSLKRFRGWGYKDHGDGWRLHPGPEGKNGRLRLSGVGLLPIRGRTRTEGTPKTMEIVHRDGRWYASVTIECEPTREHGSNPLGIDWGLEAFATLSTGERIENPRFARTDGERIKSLQREVSRKKRGSKNRRKAARKLARAHERVANRRLNFLHQQSAAIIVLAALVATEKLETAKMTHTARGTIEAPGKNVRQKAGLNRSILDGAPAAFLAMLRYKAEEAGIAFVEVPTRKVKPSQTCPRCGKVEKKTLAQRIHTCSCGLVLGRDHASAQVCLNFALYGVGNRPCVEGDVGPPLKHETPPVAASSAVQGA